MRSACLSMSREKKKLDDSVALFLCVCMYEFVCIFLCACMYEFVHTYMQIVYFMSVLNTCMYAIYIYIYIYKNTHTCINARTHINIHMVVLCCVGRRKFREDFNVKERDGKVH
jgi:hypothetical protein